MMPVNKALSEITSQDRRCTPTLAATTTAVMTAVRSKKRNSRLNGIVALSCAWAGTLTGGRGRVAERLPGLLEDSGAMRPTTTRCDR